jgi:uncharacterized coiled-coil DUF342 family protein
MADDTAAVAPGARGTGREPVFVPITPVDERRFESEIRRIDTSGADEKKNREKFETRIEKAVSDLSGELKDLRGEVKDLRNEVKDLRGEMYAEFKDLRGEMYAEFKNLRGEVNTRMEQLGNRIDKLGEHIWWVFGVVILSILLPIVMKYL